MRDAATKQAIAEAFHVKNSLEGVDFGETYAAAPGSEQPVVYLNDVGERSLTIMRWGIKLPDRLLLDDPLQHSDVIHASAFVDVILNLVKELQYQVVISTHDDAEIQLHG